ncbi:MAG: hypothetical protein JRN58_00650 [Nitrososphaerota archaeon]|nr:hypothetical protein [Nitrososphaerota archaeon]MDG6966138.1 hypothetical protein [Nitrososphaerota archaeon]MDG6968465.1 hypothetical protein [Nitrososphaerota archaeon]MDG6977573.1 hypothetical protein [Nitrososphaerota archaeon]
MQNTESDDRFKASIVATILDCKTEKAIMLLSERYRVDVPKLGVGTTKRHSKGVLAVYSADRREIRAVSSDYFYDPFVMLHEFYHHLRQFAGKHRGTEKNADRFALDYIEAYRRVTSESPATK